MLLCHLDKGTETRHVIETEWNVTNNYIVSEKVKKISRNNEVIQRERLQEVATTSGL